MRADTSEPTTVRSFGFNVPCRRFLIRANVTRDRRLPVVDEFVLRVLKVCEDVPVRRLSTYFGFTGSETEAVIADLLAAGLVTIEGNFVRLHSAAHEYFRSSEDGHPLIVDVDSWVVRVWFDLVSKNMVAPDRTRSARHLIDIRPASMARDLPHSYAEEAFKANFYEYLRRVRRMRNPDRFTLYSVSEAHPERFGSQVFRMEEELVFDPEPSLRPTLSGIEGNELIRLGRLATSMFDAYRGLNTMAPSPSALSEFTGLSGETSVTNAYRGTTRFDLPHWLSLNPISNSRRTLIGASYVRRNIEHLVKLIDEHPNLASIAAAHEREVVWYRPGGTIWGCSPELQEGLQSIKLAIRRKAGKTPIKTRLIFPDASRRDFPDRFKNLFDEGFIAPLGFLNPSVEVVHIPGIAIMVLVIVALSDSVHIPVGFASTAPELMERAMKKLVKVDAKMEELWRSERQDDDDLSPVEPKLDEDDDF